MNIPVGATANEEATQVTTLAASPNFLPAGHAEQSEGRPTMETPLEADAAGSWDTRWRVMLAQTEGGQSGTSSRDGVGAIVQPVSRNVSREAREYLRGDIETLVEGLEAIVLTASSAADVPVSSVDVGLKYLRKDRRRNPLIWVEVKTPIEVHPNQALALWDAVGLRIDRWLPRLKPGVRRLVEEQISLSVDWVEPDGHSV